MIKLIVNDVELDLKTDTIVALTKKAVELGNLQNRWSSYTNKFTIPLTKKNRDTLGVKQFQDASGSQYKYQNGKLISGGLEIASNVLVIIESVTNEITLSLRPGNGNLFDKLNRSKFSDLDFSDINHIWSAKKISLVSGNDWTDGYCYPIFQNGNQSNLKNVIIAEGMIPFVFVKYLFKKIADSFGYEWIGDTYNLDFFDKLLIPISSLNLSDEASALLGITRGTANLFYNTYNGNTYPTNYFDIQWAGGTDKWKFSINFYPNNFLNPFDFNPYTTSSINPATGYWVPLVGTYKMTYNYNIDQRSLGAIGNHFFELRVEKRIGNKLIKTIASKKITLTNTLLNTIENFSGIAELEFSVTDEDLGFYKQESNEFVICYVRYFQATTFPNYSIAEFKGNSFKIDPLSVEKTYYNRPLSFGDQLPNWTLGKFIKEVGNIFGAIYDVDEFKKTIEITRLDEIADNKIKSYDWSDKIDESEVSNISYKIEGIGKLTKWIWKDSNLFFHSEEINNEQLPESAEYIKSEAAYTLMASALNKPTQFSFIPSWNKSSNKTELDNIPRFAIFRMENSNVNLWGINIDKPNTQIALNPYPASYFYYDGSTHSLRWNDLFDLFYKDLFIPMTSRIQVVECLIKLNDLDIQSFRFNIPVYIKKFNRYFFVNEISEYTGKNQSTKVILIGI